MRRIWVTRTRPSADRVSVTLEASGYRVINAPVVEVSPTNEPLPQRLCDVAIFLSAHAVRYALQRYRIQCPNIVSIGATTRKTLEKYGIESEIPVLSSTEGLFSFLKGRFQQKSSILLVSGLGGRQDLGIWLNQIGHMVLRWYVYRRIPVYPIISQEIDLIEVASGEALKAVSKNPSLGEYFGKETPLCVPSQRIANMALQRGFKKVLLSAGAAPSDLLTSLSANQFNS